MKTELTSRFFQAVQCLACPRNSHVNPFSSDASPFTSLYAGKKRFENERLSRTFRGNVKRTYCWRSCLIINASPVSRWLSENNEIAKRLRGERRPEIVERSEGERTMPLTDELEGRFGNLQLRKRSRRGSVSPSKRSLSSREGAIEGSGFSGEIISLSWHLYATGATPVDVGSRAVTKDKMENAANCEVRTKKTVNRSRDVMTCSGRFALDDKRRAGAISALSREIQMNKSCAHSVDSILLRSPYFINQTSKCKCMHVACLLYNEKCALKCPRGISG